MTTDTSIWSTSKGEVAVSSPSLRNGMQCSEKSPEMDGDSHVVRSSLLRMTGMVGRHVELRHEGDIPLKQQGISHPTFGRVS
ncbi:MAG: hypothetical protein RLO09_14890 [Cyclobacteriaceae bacterium]